MTSTADRTGEATLRTWLARIDGIATRDDVMTMIRGLHRIGVAAESGFVLADPEQANELARWRRELAQTRQVVNQEIAIVTDGEIL